MRLVSVCDHLIVGLRYPPYCLFCVGLCMIFAVLCVCDRSGAVLCVCDRSGAVLCVCDRSGAVLCVYVCYETEFSICVDYAATECDWEVVGCLEYICEFYHCLC